MATPFVQVVGTTKSWVVTATANGRPITNKFTSGDALSAKVTEGDSRPTLFSPTVTWVDATAGTIQVVVTSAQLATAGVSRGTYRIEVVVTPVSDGQPRSVVYAPIKFLPTAGSDSSLLSYVSAEDLVSWSRGIEALLNSDVDQAGFAEARNRAFKTFNARVLNLYRPRPGGSKRYVSADGLTAGPSLRYAPSPDGSPPPSPADLAGWLTPERVILNEDVVEANARFAAAIVYGATPGQQNVYQQMAAQEMSAAEEAFCRAVVEVETKRFPDGTPDIRVARDITYLT